MLFSHDIFQRYFFGSVLKNSFSVKVEKTNWKSHEKVCQQGEYLRMTFFIYFIYTLWFVFMSCFAKTFFRTHSDCFLLLQKNIFECRQLRVFLKVCVSKISAKSFKNICEWANFSLKLPVEDWRPATLLKIISINI